MGLFSRDEKRKSNASTIDPKQQVVYDPDSKQAYAPAPQYNAAPAYDPSSAPAPLAGWACVTLSRDDRLRLVNFPPSVLDATRQVVTSVWPEGVQKEYDRSEWGSPVWEFKLHRNPWYGQGSEAVPSKRLMARFLQALAAEGWHLSVSSDLSKKDQDKDTLIFRLGAPVQREVFAVTFNESDKMRLIDSPNDQVHAAFLDAAKAWPQGVKEAKLKEMGCYQLKLKGWPWYTSDGQEVTQARILTMTLLSKFDQLGYELMSSIDMNSGQSGDSRSGSGGGLDMDSWFFASKM